MDVILCSKYRPQDKESAVVSCSAQASIDEHRSRAAYQNFIYRHTHKLRVLYLINLAPFVTRLFTKLQLFDKTLSLPVTAVKGEGATAGVFKTYL